MSACPCYPDDEVALRYVTSDLAEPERVAFEDHLFACDHCLARVERYQMAQQELSRVGLPAPPAATVGDLPRAATSPRPLAWLMLGALAASLLIVVAGWSMWPRPSDLDAPQGAERVEPAPLAAPAAGPSSIALRVAVLAMVTPPAYVTLTTRGTADSRFATAMQSYVRADWPAASRGLAPLEGPEARFYKGVADLMRGDTAEAIAAFEAAGKSGQQPYARESLFYLGKAALQHGDVAAARPLLTSARDAGAGPAGEAERLLAALSELGR